jgi:outer membrane protein assembly factor BamB
MASYTDVTTLVDPARVYVMVGPTVQALKLSDGTVEWETSLSDEVAATCRACATLAKDRLVVLASDLVLQGVDVDSREVAWSYELNTSSGRQVQPIVLDGGNVVAIVSDGAISLLLKDSKYALTPLLKEDGMLLVQAIRTKGSERHELWGVNPSSGETLWRYELQGINLLGWASNHFGAGTWTIAPVGDRLAVIQVISEDDKASLDTIVVDILNMQDGTTAIETRTVINDDHWMGTALTKGRAYLSSRNLYSVDLGTGAVDWEWPLSGPPADLIDPLGE